MGSNTAQDTSVGRPPAAHQFVEDRMRLGLALEEVAILLELSAATVSRLENGETKPTSDAGNKYRRWLDRRLEHQARAQGAGPKLGWSSPEAFVGGQAPDAIDQELPSSAEVIFGNDPRYKARAERQVQREAAQAAALPRDPVSHLEVTAAVTPDNAPAVLARLLEEGKITPEQVQALAAQAVKQDSDR